MRRIAAIGVIWAVFSVAVGAEEHQHDMGMVMQENRTIHAAGVIKSIGDDHRSVRIFHDPIPELKWPSMNMPFGVSDPHKLDGFKAGDRIRFDFVRNEGENLIVSIER